MGKLRQLLKYDMCSHKKFPRGMVDMDLRVPMEILRRVFTGLLSGWPRDVPQANDPMHVQRAAAGSVLGTFPPVFNLTVGGAII